MDNGHQNGARKNTTSKMQSPRGECTDSGQRWRNVHGHLRPEFRGRGSENFMDFPSLDGTGADQLLVQPAMRVFMEQGQRLVQPGMCVFTEQVSV